MRCRSLLSHFPFVREQGSNILAWEVPSQVQVHLGISPKENGKRVFHGTDLGEESKQVMKYILITICTYIEEYET